MQPLDRAACYLVTILARYPSTLGKQQRKGKPTVNQLGMSLNKKRDHFAEQVMRMTDAGHPVSDDEDEATNLLMRTQSKASHVKVTEATLRCTPCRSVGMCSPVVGGDLSMSTRAFMEPRFGYDFAECVHTDASPERVGTIKAATRWHTRWAGCCVWGRAICTADDGGQRVGAMNWRMLYSKRLNPARCPVCSGRRTRPRTWQASGRRWIGSRLRRKTNFYPAGRDRCCGKFVAPPLLWLIKKMLPLS